MSTAYYTMYKKFILAGRTAGMKEKLASMLGFDNLTTEEYEELMNLLKEKTE